MLSNTVSSAKSGLYDLFVQPYVDGAKNLKQATGGLKSILAQRILKSHSETAPAPLNLKERAKHLALGIGLVIPVINTIVYVVHRHFTAKAKPAKIESDNKPQVLTAKRKGVRFKEARIREFFKDEAPIAIGNLNSYTSSLNSSFKIKSNNLYTQIKSKLPKIF